MLSRRHLVQCLCGFGGLGLAGCVATPRPTIQRSGFKPKSLASADAGLWRQAEEAEKQAKRSSLRVVDGKLEGYLRDVACKVGGDICADTRVYLMRIPAFNAVMFPNGMMQIWSGLLLRVHSEAQLASVIGHEIGHYANQDTVERHETLVNSAGFAILLSLGLGGVGIPAGALVYLATAAHLYGFSREQEREADAYGARALRKAGYDVSESAAIWRQLTREREALEEKPDRDLVFSTHPSNDERIRNLDQLAKSAPKGERGEDQFREMIAPYRQGWLQDELNRASYSSMLEMLDIADERRGKDTLGLHYRGEALRRRGRKGEIKDAVAAYREALTFEDALPESYRGLGLALRAGGEHDESQDALKTYVEAAPDAPDRALIQSMLQGT